MAYELQHSAGGLVAREGRVLLIATHEGRRWQLPKGHIESGESAEETAVREVEEETGVRGQVLAPLPGVEYFFTDHRGCKIRKQVEYFLLEYVGGDTSDYDPEEVFEARWFPWEEGIERLTFDSDRRVAEAAYRIISSRPEPALEGG